MIGIVDIRSLGYYKIKQGILQQNLSRYYRFEEAEKLCEYINKFVDTLKKEREQTTPTDKYPWLDPEDERRNIVNDLILFTPSKESHVNKLEDLLKALLKKRLKILPKKCQLFKTSLQYMGNEIFIENKKVWVKPLRSRLEAIQKLQLLKTPKGCRSFVGVVNFLSMFCPELQKLPKPIYDLTRQGKPFYWGKQQQDSFEEKKCRLWKPPVLHMPNKTGRFHLYSDTSKFATGSALYQIQNGKPKLIAYVSKRLPEAAKSYSITELEL